MRKIWLLAFLLGFIGCTTSKVNIANSANLSDYNFATMVDVMSYGGSTDLMNLEVEIYNALLTTRLSIIGDKEISDMTENEKEQLLLVRFSASQRTGDHSSKRISTVAVNFVEYLTGLPVASFIGTSESDLSSAISIATKRMQESF